jgi:hypothetical protein
MPFTWVFCVRAGRHVWAAPVCSRVYPLGGGPYPRVASRETAGRACRHTASQTLTGDPPARTLCGERTLIARLPSSIR